MTAPTVTILGQSPAVQAAYARSGAALLALAVETAQECPACRAVHDETEWLREGMDDGWCSQECQDDAAQAETERRDRAGWVA